MRQGTESRNSSALEPQARPRDTGGTYLRPPSSTVWGRLCALDEPASSGAEPEHLHRLEDQTDVLVLDPRYLGTHVPNADHARTLARVADLRAPNHGVEAIGGRGKRAEEAGESILGQLAEKVPVFRVLGEMLDRGPKGPFGLVE